MRNILLFVFFVSLAAATEHPSPKVVDLSGTTPEIPVLNGPPENPGMIAGRVLLAPAKSVGEHSTGNYEELLVVLEGSGEMSLANGTKLPAQAGHALYCPPHTTHNVTNTGTRPLRYVYIVSRVTSSQ